MILLSLFRLHSLLITAFSVAVMLLPLNSFAQEVTYRVTFTGTWTADDSSSYPLSAHFTELVGATHSPGNAIWQRGGLATQGVEAVAELGSNFAIEAELSTRPQTGSFISFDSLFDLPNSGTREIVFTADKPNITLISMLAPSPDWFVGVSDLSLRPNGQWLQRLSVNLHPYDSGTEEGDSFSLSNSETVPPQPIALIGNSPFFIEKPVVGYLEFELLTPVAPLPPEDPGPRQNPNTITTIPAIQILLTN